MTENLTEWVMVPAHLAEEARIRNEKRQAAVAKYNASKKARDCRARFNVTTRRASRESGRAERPFIIWDGEQPRDTGYSLFGNSEGMEICHPFLSTQECLDLIIETEMIWPDAIHIGFGFNFDVSWILKDIGWTRLNRLKKYGRTFWNGYRIAHVSRKWFTVSYGGYTAKIFEVFSYFNKRLPDTLTEWGIGPWTETMTSGYLNGNHASGHGTVPSIKQMPGQPILPSFTEEEPQHASNARRSSLSGYLANQPISQERSCSVPSLANVRTMSEREIVESFKWVRSEFMYSDMEQIRIYMRLELKYTKLLMEKLRDTFLAAGYLPRSWHGPGALAREAFKRHGVYDRKAICPEKVREASRYAFFGGRFSPRLVGHFKRPVLSYDMNSAYPYAMTFLPNLARGSWHMTTNPREIRQAIDDNKFAVFRIAYHYEGKVEESEDWEMRVKNVAYHMFPLPRRRKDGGVGWAHKVTSWYWTPEARLVADAEEATFIAAWIFDEEAPEDRPFTWIPEYYRRRQVLKRQGNPAEYTFKIILNAGFGQCAQRVGWDQKYRLPPKTHQLEWAGYITSFCRAAMYEMVQRVGEENVISIDTDGLFTFAEIPMKEDEVGDDLGQWKCERYEDMVVWQTGMYGLKTDYCGVRECSGYKDRCSVYGHLWSKAKTRGMPKGAYSPADLVEAIDQGKTTISVMKNNFIGYGMALNNQFARLNTWVEEEVTFTLGGTGALYHWPRGCKNACPGNGTHRLKNFLFFWDPLNGESFPHYLPWLDNGEDMEDAKELGDDMTFFGDWSPDMEEEWRQTDARPSMVVQSPELAR